MIEQLYLKINIFKEKKKSGELFTERTEDQYLKQTCYELLIARPGTIQGQLFNNYYHMCD